MLGSEEIEKKGRRAGRPRKGEPEVVLIRPTATVVEGGGGRDYSVRGGEGRTKEERDALSLYRKSYDKAIVEYFRDREYWISGNGGFPCIEKWCSSLAEPVRVSEVMVWVEENPSFRRAMDIANDCIRSILLDMGMDKRYSSEFLKWGLGTIHNMAPVEKRKAVKSDADNNFNVSIEVVE